MDKKKKSILITMIIVATLLVLAGIAALVLLVIAPVRLDIDIDGITPVTHNVELTTDAFGNTALVKKNADGTVSDEDFVILTFTDTHLDTNKEASNIALAYIVRAIQDVKPDLVVFDGDTVTSGLNGPRIQQFCDALEKLGVYWCAVLGNHEGDNILSLSRKAIVRKFAAYPHCLLTDEIATMADGTEVWGNGNMQISLMGADGKVRQALFFLDSGDAISRADAKATNTPTGEYDFLKESQIRWYQEKVSALEAGTKSMVYFHIPLTEFKDVSDIAGKKEDGSFDYGIEKDGVTPLFGYHYEGVCSPVHNSGFFDAAVEAGSTQAIIVGHDHVNSYGMLYKGIKLIYNRSSGFSSYNVLTKGLSDTLAQGATIYTIDAVGTLSINDYIYSNYYDMEDAYALYR